MTAPLARLTTVLASLLLASLALAQAQPQPQQQDQQPQPEERRVVPGGELQILGPEGVSRGACPLKHTDVVANVAGLIGRTRVKQTFHNPLNEKVEAVYVFPLPNDAAVDEMVMTVGDRRIVGQVKKREEARAVYEQAKAAGHVASLLDQERPNVFTQSVANIEPGAQVTIEIAYVETLKHEDGWYEFSFPTVVGPRYMPGSPTGREGKGIAPDTTQVPDASKISPPITAKGTRAGHDIGLTVNIDAGVEVREVECRTHPVTTNHPAPGKVTVALKNQNEIPNKDFILRFRTGAEQIGDALLTHRDARGSFFTLILQPPQKVQRKDAVGRELIFVLDSSGSMSGFPITQAKFVIAKAIDSMGPQDTFNLITFSGDTTVLWDTPKPNTPQNREEAQSFLASRQGRGGTEMMKAIEAALVKTKRQQPREAGAPEPIRVVAFLTDGYVGNDFQIIDAVKKNAGMTRVFSFGIGNSVNRFLLDNMAYAGRGEVEYVTLDANSQAAAERFYKRIDAPVLTDVAIDFGTLPVADVYPRLVPDLFSTKPILVHGRLTGDVPAGAAVTLRGNTANGPFQRKVEVKAAPADASHEALASLWARSKVEDLLMRDPAAMQSGNFPEDMKNAMTALGIEFRLMTQFTSFVAVEELTITKAGKATTIAVPVEMPDGVSYEGIFGERGGAELAAVAQLGRTYYARTDRFARGRGFGAGYGGYGGVAGGPAQQQAQTRLSLRGTSPAGGATATSAPPAPAATGAVAGKEVAERKKAAKVEGRVALGDTLAETESLDKLDDSIRGLADKVEKEGKNGSLTAGGVAVEDYKLDVMVYLSDTSQKTLDALKQLGFEVAAESKAVRLLVGTIDVRKLADLAKLEAVVSVKPVK